MIFTGPIIMHDWRKPLAERKASRKYCGPYQWTPAKPGTGRGFYQACKGLQMDRAGSSFDLRLIEADELLPFSGRRPTAYWCDEYGHDKLTPIVARLPRGRGFLAGWTMGNGMCASLDATIYTDEMDAAYAAHSEAESAAEYMRDNQDNGEE